MGLRDRLRTQVQNVSQTFDRGENLVEDELTRMGQLAEEIQEEERHEEHLVHLREETLQLIKEVSVDFREIRQDQDKIDTWNHQVMKGEMPARDWFNSVKPMVQEIHADIQEIENDMRQIHKDVVQAAEEEQAAAREDEKIKELQSSIETEFEQFEEMETQVEQIFENMDENFGLGKGKEVQPRSADDLSR